MPYGTVNLVSGIPSGETAVTCTAGIGTFIVEFGSLTQLTGDPVFMNVAERALQALWQARSPLGLVSARYISLAIMFLTDFPALITIHCNCLWNHHFCTSVIDFSFLLVWSYIFSLTVLIFVYFSASSYVFLSFQFCLVIKIYTFLSLVMPWLHMKIKLFRNFLAFVDICLK